jgi:hypothetical protein
MLANIALVKLCATVQTRSGGSGPEQLSTRNRVLAACLIAEAALDPLKHIPAGCTLPAGAVVDTVDATQLSAVILNAWSRVLRVQWQDPVAPHAHALKTSALAVFCKQDPSFDCSTTTTPTPTPTIASNGASAPSYSSPEVNSRLSQGASSGTSASKAAGDGASGASGGASFVRVQVLASSAEGLLPAKVIECSTTSAFCFSPFSFLPSLHLLISYLFSSILALFSLLSTLYSLLSTLCSTLCSTLSTLCSLLSTLFSLLSSLCSLLSAPRFSLSLLSALRSLLLAFCLSDLISLPY